MIDTEKKLQFKIQLFSFIPIQLVLQNFTACWFNGDYKFCVKYSVYIMIEAEKKLQLKIYFFSFIQILWGREI